MIYFSSHPLDGLYQKSFQASLLARPPELTERLGGLAEFVIEGLAKGAGDIYLHFEAGSKKVAGSMRVDGELLPCGPEIDMEPGLEALARLAKIPPQWSLRLLEEPVDFDLRLDFGAIGEFCIRMRGAAIPLSGGGLQVAFRNYPAPRYDLFQAAVERAEFEAAARPAAGPSLCGGASRL